MEQGRYYVLEDSSGAAVHTWHSRFRDAEQEAQSCARNYPGTRFIVAMATRGYRCVDIESVEFSRNDDPDIPF